MKIVIEGGRERKLLVKVKVRDNKIVELYIVYNR